jgi:hypothetical protein
MSAIDPSGHRFKLHRELLIDGRRGLQHTPHSGVAWRRRRSLMGLARNLALLTAAKIAALALIYVWLFAPFAHAPIDPAEHIAGPAPLHVTAH